MISRPRLANARRRGTAGPARDAIGARRAAGVGTVRPRRRRSPAPRDRRATGSASASRRFARLTHVIHPSRRRCDVFPKQAKTNNKKAKSAATPRKASSAWTDAENAALAAGVAKHGAGTSLPETRSATIAEHPARFPDVRADRARGKIAPASFGDEPSEDDDDV